MNKEQLINHHNNLLTKYKKLEKIEAGFNKKGWDKLKEKVTFDLNNVYLLMDKIKLKLEENYFQFKDWELKNNGVVRYSNPCEIL